MTDVRKIKQNKPKSETNPQTFCFECHRLIAEHDKSSFIDMDIRGEHPVCLPFRKKLLPDLLGFDHRQFREV